MDDMLITLHPTSRPVQSIDKRCSQRRLRQTKRWCFGFDTMENLPSSAGDVLLPATPSTPLNLRLDSSLD